MELDLASWVAPHRNFLGRGQRWGTVEWADESQAAGQGTTKEGRVYLDD